MALTAACAACLLQLLLLLMSPALISGFVRRGEVQLPAEVQCPSGMFSDPNTPQLKVTHLCVPANKRDCVPGTTWKEQCSTCTCPAEDSGSRTAVCPQNTCQEAYEPPLDRGDTRLCGWRATDCPAGCQFLQRDWRCTYCWCGGQTEAPSPAPHTSRLSQPCPPGRSSRLANLCTPAIRITDRRAPPSGRENNSRRSWQPPEALASLARPARGSSGGWTSLKEASRAARARVN